MPTGRVKWYDATKGFGFVTSDEGGDVFLPKGALPAGVIDLKTGQRIEFGVVDSRKGAQALGVKLLDAPPSLAARDAEARRRPAEETASMIEDMIKVLETSVQPTLQRGRYPDKKAAAKIAQLLHAIADEFDRAG
ncbi:cold-shock protein [Actinoplanes sp. NPDC020271]|uniref:cold-shock protein n=1 Tax=Actinoplanes sp. NPDC020271 TaxID=3363896 RepID=UPI0037A55DC0